MYSSNQINFIVGVILLVVFSSCSKPDAPSSGYYPVDSLIHSQASHLAEVNATLTKKAQINGTEETVEFTPADSAAWLNELDIFALLNTINKPVYRGNYAVTEGTDGENSNLTVRTFTSKANLPVAWLKVFYLDHPRNIRRIEALYREASSLLKGSRMLVMDFREVNNKITLTSYTIEGGQEMFMGKPVEFSLSGTVTVPSWPGVTENH